MAAPAQARTVQDCPPGRRPSNSVSHSGTVATMSAAMPLGMRFSDHITNAFPIASSSTPMSA